MGLIEKAIRERSNQKLAEPICTSTTMSVGAVIEELRSLCDAHNAETVLDVERWKTTGNRFSRWVHKDKDPTREHYYHVRVHEREVLIGFRLTPERILEKKNSGADPFWLARLRFPVTDDDSRLVVESTLLRWVIDGNNGKLHDRGFYELLVDRLFNAVNVDGPAAEI